MSKIAIIYTGEVRTCETTLPLFKKNVLLNDNYHVFAVIQSTNNNDYYENLIKHNIGENLKSFSLFDKNNDYWLDLREKLINNIHIDEGWLNYLKNSGSMIEYYQMYLAYKNIEVFEKTNDISYNYVLRVRTDTVLKDIINFEYQNFDKEYIKYLLYKIKDKMNYECIHSIETLTMFMNTIYNEKRINYNNFCFENIPHSEEFKKLLSNENYNENAFIIKLQEYLNNGNYVIALRVNNVYFMKRELMNKIHILGITYGKYKLDNETYWFNAESQLKQICVENNIDFYSSCCDLEDKSLYEYNNNNYFDNNNNLIDNNFSFFVKRY